MIFLPYFYIFLSNNKILLPKQILGKPRESARIHSLDLGGKNSKKEKLKSYLNKTQKRLNNQQLNWLHEEYVRLKWRRWQLIAAKTCLIAQGIFVEAAEIWETTDWESTSTWEGDRPSRRHHITRQIFQWEFEYK